MQLNKLNIITIDISSDIIWTDDWYYSFCSISFQWQWFYHWVIFGKSMQNIVITLLGFFNGNEKKKNVVKTWPYGFVHDVIVIRIY